MGNEYPLRHRFIARGLDASIVLSMVDNLSNSLGKPLVRLAPLIGVDEWFDPTTGRFPGIVRESVKPV